MTYLFFKFLSGFACYLPAFVRYLGTLAITLWISGLGNFGSGGFGKNVEGEFHVCHIVAE